MQILSLDSIGTHLALSVDTDRDMADIFHDIRVYLEAFEARYSRFLTGNWLSDLHQTRRAILDHDAREMLIYGLDMAERTEGYFDPTIARRLTELGYGAEIGESLDSRGQILDDRREEKYGDYRDIEIIGDEVVLHGDISLEFGGVGKGYLIDRIRGMIEGYFSEVYSLSISVDQHSNTLIFKDSNLRYLIDFGGDLYGKGGWDVGLESPLAPDEVIGTISLDDHYLACSAGTRRRWGSHHHLIDPHTGESSHEVIASYIETIGSDISGGMIADAYAMTLCVMPWELAIYTLQETPEISGVIVRYDGVLYQKGGSRSEIFTS